MATLTATAEPFTLNAGSPNVATLAIGGKPLAQAIVTAIHQTDWQGRVVLSNQPRTNYVVQSAGFTTASWALTGGTLTAGQADPFGTTTATLFTSNATGGAVCYLSQNVALRAGTLQFKALVKSGTASKLWVQINIGNDASFIVADLAAGTWGMPQFQAGAGTVYANLAIAPATNGFSVVEADVIVPSGATSATAYFGPTNSLTTRSATSGETMTFAGVMFGDAGAYIPTTTAAVTVTDYTQAGTQPQITLGQNPATGATLDWDGTGILPGQNWSWPLALPKISSDNFAYAPLVDNVLVTQMETGAPKRRRRFTYVPETLTGTLTLTGAQAATLETFVAMALRDVQPFDWKDLRDGSVASYIFTKRPTFTQVAGGVDLWSTAIELMKQ